jgi:hypothetical protein
MSEEPSGRFERALHDRHEFRKWVTWLGATTVLAELALSVAIIATR